MARNEQWTAPSPAEIKKMWTDCETDMLDTRRNFWLNSSFFHGDQWIGWNDVDLHATVLPFADEDEAANRTTVNKFKPRVTSYLARLLRTPLAFEPRPGGVDDQAMRISRIERQVLEAKHHHDDWEDVRADELQSTVLGGVAAVCIDQSWKMSTTEVKDALTGETIRLPEQPSIMPSALACTEFGIEPGARDSASARYWIKATTLTPKAARDHYNLDYDPAPDADSAMSPMHRMLSAQRSRSGRRENNACLVLVYYERPCNNSPGCVRHVIGGKVVEESAWPFPFKDRLNIQTFVQTRISGTWRGDTICNDARQLQKNYNKAYTSINAHIGRADNARLLVPMGSLAEGEDEMTGEAGEIVRYDASAGGIPQWMSPPEVARWMREHIPRLEAEMDELFSTHAVTRGEAPGDRNSGLALSILAEKDETPLAMMASSQQRGWQAVAQMVLECERFLMQQADALMQQYGVPGDGFQVQATIPQQGSETPMQVNYRAQDISEHPTVHVPLESVMPRSVAATQDMMIRLGQSFPQLVAALAPAQLATLLQVPDQAAFAVAADAQVQEAQWENGRMAAGADDNEVTVEEWQNHETHITEHNKLRASGAYREADDQVKAYIDMHIQGHTVVAQQLIEAAMAKQTAMAQQQQMSLPFREGEQPPAPEGKPAESQGVPA